MGNVCRCLCDDSSPGENVPFLRPSTDQSFEAVREVEGAPIGKKWYHGGIDDNEAEYRLKSVARENGDYLVYDSRHRRGQDYILLVFYNGKCHRWQITRRRDGNYIIGRDAPGVTSYKSVRELIKHHRGVINSKPLKLEYGGSVKLTNYAFVPENSGNAKWTTNPW